jgi:hypothetical protein
MDNEVDDFLARVSGEDIDELKQVWAKIVELGHQEAINSWARRGMRTSDEAPWLVHFMYGLMETLGIWYKLHRSTLCDFGVRGDARINSRGGITYGVPGTGIGDQ